MEGGKESLLAMLCCDLQWSKIASYKRPKGDTSIRMPFCNYFQLVQLFRHSILDAEREWVTVKRL
jgi:hypothetical protein